MILRQTTRDNFSMGLFLAICFLALPFITTAQGKIAFMSNRDGDSEIYVMNPDGTFQTQLTNNSTPDERPAFGPYGDRIAFQAVRNGNADIYVMNRDGSDETRLTDDVATDDSPAFSPNGSKIAFTSFRDGVAEVYVMNSDGTNQTRLTTSGGFAPAFSPDGSMIAFTSYRDGNDEIYLMNVNGTGQVNITNNASQEQDPTFSPDGSKIAFRSDRDGNYEIYIVNPNGSGPTNLTNHDGNDFGPTFSPDGSKIAFQSGRDLNAEIYVMNSDGSDQGNITNHSNIDVAPSWGNAPSCSTVSFDPTSLPSRMAGDIYIQRISAYGIGGQFRYAITSGSLPAGLSLNEMGDITGVPTNSGVFNFTVTATNTEFGCAASQNYSLEIACPVVGVDPPSFPSLTVGRQEGRQIYASGMSGPFNFAVTSGTLPNGMTLHSLGDFTGIPTESGWFNFTVTATNPEYACGGSRSYSLEVACPPVAMTPSTVPNTIVGDPYSREISTNGIGGQFTYAVTSGSLPDGMTLHPLGNIEGIATRSGTFNFTITATNTEFGCPASQAYSITVLDNTPPVIVPTVSGTLGNNGWYTSNVGVSWTVTDGGSDVTAQNGCDAQTVTTDTAGVTFTCSATSGGGTASDSVTIKRDETPPLIDRGPRTLANGNGWNNTNVAVQWFCSDALSGEATLTPGRILTTEGQNQSATGTCEDNAGNTASDTQTGINIDKTAPNITYVSRTAPNANGWNNTDVVVSWSCGDALSGVSSSTATQTVSGEGQNQSSAGTCEDKAGNPASDTQTGINIDKTAPNITFVSRTAPNANGWNKTDVVVSWNCSDALSGVFSSTGTQTVSTEGQNQNAAGTCQDNAGHTASDTQTGINIDKTSPNITFVSRTAPNAYGWNNTDVVVSWNCGDTLSGVLSSTTAQTVSGEGQNQSTAGTCDDKAGNSSSNTQNGISIDKTAPTLNPSVSPNPVLLGGTATASSGASDTLSGIASESCGTPDTSSVGGKTVNCTATDSAGNTVNTNANYRVIYNFAGFFQPVDNLPVLNEVRAGSSIPVKFSLGGNQGLNIFTTGYPGSAVVSCGISTAADAIEETVNAGGSTLSYDAAADRYIYVWKTEKSWKGQCRLLLVRLKDGNTYIANFSFK